MWRRGFVNPIWSDDYKNFKYIRSPLDPSSVEDWQKQGYTHKNFNGLLYNGENIIPDWCNIVSQEIGLTSCGFSFYKMKTGDIMPRHFDYFKKYCNIFNVKKENVYRSIVFLEDWTQGHYFDINSECIVNYKKGEYILWSHEEEHSAANIGVIDRYTLQITGLLNDTR